VLHVFFLTKTRFEGQSLAMFIPEKDNHSLLCDIAKVGCRLKVRSLLRMRLSDKNKGVGSFDCAGIKWIVIVKGKGNIILKRESKKTALLMPYLRVTLGKCAFDFENIWWELCQEKKDICKENAHLRELVARGEEYGTLDFSLEMICMNFPSYWSRKDHKKTADYFFETIWMSCTPKHFLSENRDPLRAYASKLTSDRELSDVELRCQERSFPCHKIVLASQSPVLEAMFLRDFKEKRSNVITLSGVDPCILEALLSFMYTRHCPDLSVEDLCQLLVAADMYQVSELKRDCAVLLMKRIHLENVIGTLQVAETIGEKDFLKATVNYFQLRKYFCPKYDHLRGKLNKLFNVHSNLKSVFEENDPALDEKASFSTQMRFMFTSVPPPNQPLAMEVIDEDDMQHFHMW